MFLVPVSFDLLCLLNVLFIILYNIQKQNTVSWDCSHICRSVLNLHFILCKNTVTVICYLCIYYVCHDNDLNISVSSKWGKKRIIQKYISMHLISNSNSLCDQKQIFFSNTIWSDSNRHVCVIITAVWTLQNKVTNT